MVGDARRGRGTGWGGGSGGGRRGGARLGKETVALRRKLHRVGEKTVECRWVLLEKVSKKGVEPFARNGPSRHAVMRKQAVEVIVVPPRIVPKVPRMLGNGWREGCIRTIPVMGGRVTGRGNEGGGVCKKRPRPGGIIHRWSGPSVASGASRPRDRVVGGVVR